MVTGHRKFFLLIILAVFFIKTPLIGKVEGNIYFDLGTAFSEIKGIFCDIGFQLSPSRNFYTELKFEFYFNPLESELFTNGYGINLNGLYKQPLIRGVCIFAEAGVHLTILEWSTDPLFLEKTTDTHLGLNAGGGLEFDFSKNVGIKTSFVYKIMFRGEASKWYKIALGIYYRGNE